MKFTSVFIVLSCLFNTLCLKFANLLLLSMLRLNHCYYLSLITFYAICTWILYLFFYLIFFTCILTILYTYLYILENTYTSRFFYLYIMYFIPWLCTWVTVIVFKSLLQVFFLSIHYVFCSVTLYLLLIPVTTNLLN